MYRYIIFGYIVHIHGHVLVVYSIHKLILVLLRLFETCLFFKKNNNFILILLNSICFTKFFILCFFFIFSLNSA